MMIKVEVFLDSSVYGSIYIPIFYILFMLLLK